MKYVSECVFLSLSIFFGALFCKLAVLLSFEHIVFITLFYRCIVCFSCCLGKQTVDVSTVQNSWLVMSS